MVNCIFVEVGSLYEPPQTGHLHLVPHFTLTKRDVIVAEACMQALAY